MKNLVFLLLILTATVATKGQSRQLIESKEAIISQAVKELDSAMRAPDGELYAFGQKEKIVGEYTLQLTIRDKGDVVSVFVSDKKNADIPSQNKLKDRILKFRFSFKMPKNKDYKFNYLFTF